MLLRAGRSSQDWGTQGTTAAGWDSSQPPLVDIWRREMRSECCCPAHHPPLAASLARVTWLHRYRRETSSHVTRHKPEYTSLTSSHGSTTNVKTTVCTDHLSLLLIKRSLNRSRTRKSPPHHWPLPVLSSVQKKIYFLLLFYWRDERVLRHQTSSRLGLQSRPGQARSDWTFFLGHKISPVHNLLYQKFSYLLKIIQNVNNW